MQLIIDYRETKLIDKYKTLINNDEKFKLLRDKFKTENLELGDIIIRNENNEDILIIERKSISDLIASIKDGRYKEQSIRLDSLNIHNHNIIYLIEGNMKVGVQYKQTIYSAMFSINYYKGFSVLRTYEIDESVYVICNIFAKILKEKEKKPYYILNSTIQNIKDNEENKKEDTISENLNKVEKQLSYTSTIKKKKSDNITPENFGEIVLIQIPGISNITASAIMKEYNTLNNLIEKLKENKDILNTFTYQNDKNQTRKLNKPCIQNILKFLLL